MAFVYNLSQNVRILPGSEVGVVDKRMDQVSGPNQYLVHYLDTQGNSHQRWIAEYHLSLPGSPGPVPPG